MRLKDDENIIKHIKQFSNAVDKLRELGIPMADDLVSILLLNTLPDRYEGFRVAIEARDDLPTSEVLKVKLKTEAATRANKAKHNEQVPSQQEVQANFSQKVFNDRKRQAGGSNQQQRGGKRRPFFCTYCDKQGHKANDCFKKKRDQEEKEKAAIVDGENQQDSNEQSGSDSEAWIVMTEGEILETALRTDITSNEHWYVDSGATSHMCDSKTTLSNQHRVEGQRVSMADGGVTEISERGTARLQLDGKQGLLENTLRVPNLKGNLISVAKITDNDRTVIFNNKGVIIKGRNGKLVARGTRVGNLYKIESSLETTAKATSENNKLMEWHKQYGHLNEADLKK